MSDIDVEGSDDEIIVVTESPERHIDIDVEAVTDEELFPDSEVVKLKLFKIKTINVLYHLFYWNLFCHYISMYVHS